LVTVVGHSATTAAGEWITATGEWVNDRTPWPAVQGPTAPTSTEGIEKSLSSGIIRGIGPVYAKKLVRAFSEKVFDVIEAEPDRLREVDGIGPVRAKRIVVADTVGENACVLLAGLHRAERNIADRLLGPVGGSLPWPSIDPDTALPWSPSASSLPFRRWPARCRAAVPRFDCRWLLIQIRATRCIPAKWGQPALA
jgi:ATP-dependent exoDNAse (exonuclease V) alpha subunit